jgi:hypothetical protein
MRVSYSQHLPIAHHGHVMSVGVCASVLFGNGIAIVVELLCTIWRWCALRICELDGCRLSMVGAECRHGGRVQGRATTAMLDRNKRIEGEKRRERWRAKG